MAPAGTTITASIPARAAYAAADAAVLPVEAHTSRVTPCSSARETASAMPRSLNEPVGFAPSHLSHSSTPNRSESRGAARSGVLPSPSVITGPSLLRCDGGQQKLGDLDRVERRALDQVVAGQEEHEAVRRRAIGPDAANQDILRLRGVAGRRHLDDLHRRRVTEDRLRLLRRQLFLQLDPD